ncbi:hypothetical protein THAOC_26411, partial [Thalassiosira oceanica]
EKAAGHQRSFHSRSLSDGGDTGAGGSTASEISEHHLLGWGNSGGGGSLEKLRKFRRKKAENRRAPSHGSGGDLSHEEKILRKRAEHRSAGDVGGPGSGSGDFLDRRGVAMRRKQLDGAGGDGGRRRRRRKRLPRPRDPGGGPPGPRKQRRPRPGGEREEGI